MFFKLLNEKYEMRITLLWAVFLGVSSITVVCSGSSNSQVKRAGSLSNVEKNCRKVSVTVDPRVELMSVIFYIAGNKEYDMCVCRSYIQKVDEYFKPYKGHKAIQMARKLRKDRGVNCNAPMSLAIHINDINSMATIVPLKPRPQNLDSRWRIDETQEFLKVCRDFVQDTKFETYLAGNKLIYDKAVDKLKKLVETKVDLEWFDKFFGKNTNINFNLVISILNGKSCYGPRVQIGEKLHIYSILGVVHCGVLGFGEPQFPDRVIDTIVHEFGHSYSNPLVEKYIQELRSAGKKLYPAVKKQMKSQAYGNWQTMMKESVVRAASVRYHYANGSESKARRAIEYNIGRGFSWTNELAELLGEYETQRDVYPDLDAFFPRIVEFFNSYAKKHG